MKKSMCPNQDCLSTKGFEAAESTVKLNQKLPNVPIYLVQCKSCGTVVGSDFQVNLMSSLKIIG